MNIASFSIKRPVFASVLSITIILFGFVGFNMLGLREFPSVDPPIVTVSTSYVGANADVISTQITEILEESINGIAGIRTLTSSSADGRSNISVEFNIGEDMEAAANDVRDRVSRVMRQLPQDCDPPVVVKTDADADAILILGIQSDTRSLLDLTDFGINVFKERLQTIPGVSNVSFFGEKKYAMRLQLDPERLTAFHISPNDIKNALQRENVELPSGRIEGYERELTIRTLGRLSTEEEFNNLLIKEENGAVVRLKDVGLAHLDAENMRSANRGNGSIMQIALAIQPQPGSNHIAIADEFYKRLDQLKKEIPSDIKTIIISDNSVNIRKGIKEVEETIFFAFALVVLVIFIFLRQWRTTLIPVLAIPISLIGTFFLMYVSGFTINLLTLLGVVLATGLVVDDAIVVLENIYKKIEAGENPVVAGHKGSEEIIFAIISTTITLAAVFLPIIFLGGLTGRLFREFAVTVAGSVIISAFVSLTLTPMMCSRMLKKSTSESKIYLWSERLFERMNGGYNRWLRSFILHKWIAFSIMGASLVIIFWIGMKIPSELAPMEDKSRVRITMTAPEGTAFEAMDQYVKEISEFLDTIPEKATIMTVTSAGGGGTNGAMARIGLVPPAERKRSQQEITDYINGKLRRMNFARAYATQEQTIATTRRGAGLPVQFVILAPDFAQLKTALPKFLEKAQDSKAFQLVDVDLKFNKPELRVEIDRDRAKAMGVSVRDVAENLSLYFSQQRYGYFILRDKQYQVIGEATRVNRDDPRDLSSIYIRNSAGNLIQLDNVLRLSNQSNPPQIYRFNRYVSATVSAQPAEGVALGQGIDEMRKIGKVVLGENFATTLAGTSRDLAESSSSLLYAFIFTLILIYLVLAAQFESYRDPLIVMFTVPLAMAGAVLSLYFFNQTLNIFSEIGVIVLIGIVTKNGILIVEFANQKKDQGKSLKEAVLEAATLRLRPILMTSLATALGALPIALALGAAAKSRIPMGITIIGGLMFSLVLTLFVIPTLYTLISGKRKLDSEDELQMNLED
ncbi:MAG: efflux RND transporter permease subunit [Bacteroidia bacterium]|nr:efflux RND transporter permease subunit [Bacteroidia bacterium]